MIALVNSNYLFHSFFPFISDTMAAQVAYGTGRIQFIPDGRQGDQRNYSDRSIILLLEENFPNSVLIARDVENNNRV